MGEGMAAFKGRKDALCPGKKMETFDSLFIRDGDIFRPSFLFKEGVLRPDARIIEAGREGVSLLDIPGIISAFPFAVRFLAKKSLLRIPVFGWYLYLSGHILIERDSVKSALKGLKRASSALQQGISVIVFPEGTRSLDGEVKEFKGGAFLLAQNSKSPLVPIGISGSFEMLPRTGWCFRPGIMHIRIGEPISTRDLSPQESRNLMGTVRHTIIQSLKA